MRDGEVACGRPPLRVWSTLVEHSAAPLLEEQLVVMEKMSVLGNCAAAETAGFGAEDLILCFFTGSSSSDESARLSHLLYDSGIHRARQL